MICVINCGTFWLEEIKKNLAGLDYSYTVIDLREIKDCNFTSFSGIIISGAPILLTKSGLQKYLDLFCFLKTIKIPVLGICFGHQIMGLLYGTKIYKGELINKREAIEILKDDALFKGLENKSLFREEHSEYITLPKHFLLLAKSNSCKNEAMRHKHKRLYGVQFHPEVSGNNGKQIFNNFLNICSS